VAVIFFGKITIEEYNPLLNIPMEEFESKNKHRISYQDFRAQIKPFIEAGVQETTRFINFLENNLFICEPEGEARNMEEHECDKCDEELKKLGVKLIGRTFDQDVPKYILLKESIQYTKFPYILRTLQTNRYLIREICRKINPNKNWAAIQAIKSLIGEKIEIPKKLNAKLIITPFGVSSCWISIFLKFLLNFSLNFFNNFYAIIISGADITKIFRNRSFNYEKLP